MTAQTETLTNIPGLIVGAKLSTNGMTYLVTKDGIERLKGVRKERRAQIAAMRKAGRV